MNKYFEIHADSELWVDYFAYKDNQGRISEAVKKVCEKFGIESREFYLRQDRFHIVPTENDYKKFCHMMKKDSHGEFKKTSEPSKVWIELVKDIKPFRKPQFFYYFDLLGHHWKERLFNVDSNLYGSIESDGEIKLPDFVTEMKASEFYKIIEDYEERCKS